MVFRDRDDGDSISNSAQSRRMRTFVYACCTLKAAGMHCSTRLRDGHTSRGLNVQARSGIHFFIILLAGTSPSA